MIFNRMFFNRKITKLGLWFFKKYIMPKKSEKSVSPQDGMGY